MARTRGPMGADRGPRVDLAARGLPTACIHQILGGNALKFLGRVL